MKYVFENYILYEDNHLLIINKPANLLSQADNTKDDDCVNLAKEYLKYKYNKPGNVYVGLVHRLDRMTEGVLVLTKTSKAAARLSEEIKNNEWHKEYIAVVKGHIDQGTKLTNWVDHIDDTKKMQVVKVGTGQKAELIFDVLGYVGDNTVIKVNLLTGRHHQIRLQLANYGHPLIGDTLYGNIKDRTDLMLACVNISFKHPTQDVVMNVKCLPKSKKWQKIIEDHILENLN